MFANTISIAAAVLAFSSFVYANLDVGAGTVQVAKVPNVAVAGAGAAALVTVDRHDVCISSSIIFLTLTNSLGLRVRSC